MLCIANRWRGVQVLAVCCNLKGFSLNFNPVSGLQLAATSCLNFTVYHDFAIQYAEFSLSAILGNVGKLKELGKADGICLDGNFRHVTHRGKEGKETARG